MKKYFWVILIIAGTASIVFLSKCAKLTITPFCINNTYKQDSLVIDSILVARNEKTSYVTDSPFLYKIIDPGTGSQPTRDSAVQYEYQAKYLTDTTQVFDMQLLAATDTAHTVVRSLRPVLDSGITKIRQGGRVLVIVPSSSAFGCTGTYNTNTSRPAIPGNMQVLYDIRLVHVRR